MGIDESCSSCRYLRETALGADCRRNPPVIVEAEITYDLAQPDKAEGFPTTFGRWPDVGMDDWCGEYAANRSIDG